MLKLAQCDLSVHKWACAICSAASTSWMMLADGAANQLNHRMTKNTNVTVKCRSEPCHFFCSCFMVSKVSSRDFLMGTRQTKVREAVGLMAALLKKKGVKKAPCADNEIHVTACIIRRHKHCFSFLLVLRCICEISNTLVRKILLKKKTAIWIVNVPNYVQITQPWFGDVISRLTVLNQCLKKCRVKLLENQKQDSVLTGYSSFGTTGTVLSGCIWRNLAPVSHDFRLLWFQDWKSLVQ